jgi:hypothetical protein
MEVMNFFSSTSANDYLYQKEWTAAPGASMYVKDGLKFTPIWIPISTTICRFDMLKPNDTDVSDVTESQGQEESLAGHTNDYEEFDIFLNDAIKRFKEIYNGSDPDKTKADKFLSALKSLSGKNNLKPYIIFNKFAVKVQLNVADKEFILDYDYEDLNTVFILLSKDGTIFVKECTIDRIEETLGSF